jgi:hypothetical protein
MIRKASFALALLGALLLSTVPASAAVNVPINGDIFSGTFQIQSFATRTINGTQTLVAVGQLSGILQTATGAVNVAVGNVALPVGNMSVTGQNGACEILHLELGPLDLDLLGLQVHLDQVVLDISAQPGPGNLLGNLLCQIAGLLDGGLTNVNGLVALLNRLLAILG